MPQTLYASFPDLSMAEKAAGALLDYGVRQEDISLVSNQGTSPVDATTGTERQDFATHSATLEERTTSGASTIPVEDDDVYASGHSGTQERRSFGNEVAEGGDRFGARVSSALGATNTASNFEAAADARAANDPAYTATMGGADNRDVNNTFTDADANDQADTAADNWNRANEPNRTELAAKQGLSTTTGADATVGAEKGAGIGLGVGILAAIASMIVPGFGLVAGGGALATAIGGVVGSTVAGGIAGGVTGYLKDQGVPEEAAMRYNDAYQGGGTVLGVTVPSNGIDRETVEQVMHKYGAGNVGAYGSAA